MENGEVAESVLAQLQIAQCSERHCKCRSAARAEHYAQRGCSPTFNPSNANGSYTLRATNFVLLDAGTTINPSGTGAYFAVQTLECPD